MGSFKHELFLLYTDIQIQFELVINDTFNEALKQKNSSEYTTACDTYGNDVRMKINSQRYKD